MAHWRTMLDSEYLGAWDLTGSDGKSRDVTVTISDVRAGSLVGEKGRTTKKPIVHFRGKKKGLAANVTNCKTIAGMYGNEMRAWVGRQITLYVTQTRAPDGSTTDCIRIRPSAPQGREDAPPDEPAVEAGREPGEEG